jgi:hypothetical protein
LSQTVSDQIKALPKLGIPFQRAIIMTYMVALGIMAATYAVFAVVGLIFPDLALTATGFVDSVFKLTLFFMFAPIYILLIFLHIIINGAGTILTMVWNTVINEYIFMAIGLNFPDVTWVDIPFIAWLSDVTTAANAIKDLLIDSVPAADTGE